ncbi:MAG: hypothetical protein WCE38_06355 [Burkholderiales bacterium]
MSDPRPGRFCPSSYRYPPASLARAHRSYFQRIVTGPAHARSQAEPAVIELDPGRHASAQRG